MNLIKSFYKTKSLMKNGFFITTSAISLLLIGFFIPDFTPADINRQIYTLNGFNTKYNDNTELSEFYKSIKKNNGFLILGTSETTDINGGNYFDFLNNDPDIDDSKFSVLAGAGRTCGIHIPLFLHHKSEVNSLKVIYFINPVYWRTDLCEVNMEYWNRYSNYKVCSELTLSQEESYTFFKPVTSYTDNLNWFMKASQYTEQTLRLARKNYFNNLRYHLYPDEYASQFKYVSSSKYDYTNDSNFGNPNLALIDTTWNISKSFKDKNWFKPINTSSQYRYEELTSFIKLCENLNVQTTFIIGPYNEQFIKQHEPNSLAGYKTTTQNIKQLLIDNNVNYIDATNISPVIGAFHDHQHHSSYGAYLIYLKIKQHFYE